MVWGFLQLAMASMPVPSPTITDSPTWCLHASALRSHSAPSQSPEQPQAQRQQRPLWLRIKVGLHGPAWPAAQAPPQTAACLQVKGYVEAQWAKILAGRVSVADFVFAKEVRLGTYSGKPGAVAPPAAIVAAHAMALDPRAEPRFGERIPYVVVHGPPGGLLVLPVLRPWP